MTRLTDFEEYLRQRADPQMKGWKWSRDLRILIGIIAALIFTIWIVAVLLNARRLVEIGLSEEVSHEIHQG